MQRYRWLLGRYQPMAQAIPRWLSVRGASGAAGAMVLVVGASWAWKTPRGLAGGISSGRATEATSIRGVSTTATAAEEETHGGEECDCTPLWSCMQSGNGGCELLDKQLRACLARQKLRATRNGETVHSA